MKMKNIALILSCTCLLWGSVNAQEAKIADNAKRENVTAKKSRMTINHNGIHLDIDGEVKISDDDKHIQYLSPKGEINYRNKNQRLEIKADNDGNLSYRINGDKVQTLSTSDRQLIARCVQVMINSGIGAEDRAKRIFSREGATGIWREVEQLENDYAKRIYLSTLLNQPLSTAQMVAFLNRTNQYLSSDYYKSELLNSVMVSYLEKPETFEAYLNVIRNIQSDYYQYTMVQRLLGHPLSEKQFDGVLTVANDIKSDYYQSEVLKSLLKNNDLKDKKTEPVMQAIFNLKSDYYKTEILKLLTDKELSNDKEWSNMIDHVQYIKSDHYKTEILTRIAERMPKNDRLNQAWQNAAKLIQSDHHYGKLMRDK